MLYHDTLMIQICLIIDDNDWLIYRYNVRKHRIIKDLL